MYKLFSKMKIGSKILTSFIVIIAIIIALVGVFLISVFSINSSNTLNAHTYRVMLAYEDILTSLINTETGERGFLIAGEDSFLEPFKAGQANFITAWTETKGLTSDNPDQGVILDKIKTLQQKLITIFNDAIEIRQNQALYDVVSNELKKLGKDTMDELRSLIDQGTAMEESLLVVREAAAQSALDTTIMVAIIGLAVAIIFSILLSNIAAKSITRGTSQLVECSKRLAQGDVEVSLDIHSRDEIGELATAFTTMVNSIQEQAHMVELVADGDLTVDVRPRSDRDLLNQKLQQMVEMNHEVMTQIMHSTSQVSTGSKQIADGAQLLAQGSTQQASAVEELSSSISAIATKTQANAELALRAAQLSGTIKNNAQKGSSQMNQMMEAVREINEASKNINKVIKVIDDIAFQTNILALNAAVEAARAGQHGKGFAVVAEEVRSLAAKSASAAKDTGSLIASSMEKAELGARIASETAASLVEIVSGINESTDIISDIAKSSEEQSAGIRQINTGIDQVAQVVQQNSATAEESAAASEEMSGQSNMLEELVSQFKIKESHSKISSSGTSSRRQITMPKKPDISRMSSNSSVSDFGKY